MVEVHTLTVTEENPGITVTEAALKRNRTRGAVSQIISKLEKRDLIIRKKSQLSFGRRTGITKLLASYFAVLLGPFNFSSFLRQCFIIRTQPIK
ncbi:MarR family transcriptional regulator [Bacillus siamensis]|uniref:MarR family transcriptional regulator n=1 Tax=Bacillus siamensis TaxID=659243 RepID=UPI0009798C62|nr:helix-turn-helix domain-containing protein [Bacillus siamensis]